MKKKVISLLAVLALCLAFAVPAFAADTQYKGRGLCKLLSPHGLWLLLYLHGQGREL